MPLALQKDLPQLSLSSQVAIRKKMEKIKKKNTRNLSTKLSKKFKLYEKSSFLNHIRNLEEIKKNLALDIYFDCRPSVYYIILLITSNVCDFSGNRASFYCSAFCMFYENIIKEIGI